jgi:phage FluMu gp28-like protein
MKEMGFRVSLYDTGLWIHTTQPNLYVTSHVDDFKIACENRDDGDWFLNELGAQFEIKNLSEMRRYLGMDITRNVDAGVCLQLYVVAAAKRMREVVELTTGAYVSINSLSSKFPRITYLVLGLKLFPEIGVSSSNGFLR